MDDGITCLVCGNTDFYKESGYYFCSECQTQSQDVREQVFEEFEVNQERRHTKVIETKPKIPLEKVKLTTWESFNYVLKGLTEELISLGAEGILREIVKKLWMKYLLKIEVINRERPKLQAVNSRIDAEIVYGKRKRKRKKRSQSKTSKVSDSDLSSMDASSRRKEYTKRRSALLRAQYNESLVKSEDKSLLNETVGSLKNDSEKSSQSSVPLQYNTYATRELNRQQSEEHLEAHANDFESELQCHKNTWKEASVSYRNSSYLLSINKIYSILYLALLIAKSKVQLSDMLRFIREGHLSFNNFKHFFPEEMQENYLTEKDPKHHILLSLKLRKSTMRLAKFLDVLHYLQVQNLAGMVEKFCRELNLPRVIEDRVLGILMISQPKMKAFKNSMNIPNYEGRVLSLILFQLKLCFGLDDKTEKCLSRFCKSGMFDVMKWIQYLDYRRSALLKVHFPSQFAVDRRCRDTKLFLKFALSKNPEYEQLDYTRKYNKLADDCRTLLLKLKAHQGEVEAPVEFKASLTPCRDYSSCIVNNKLVGEVEIKVLKQDFSQCSIEYLKNPTEFFPNIQVRPGGANGNVKMFGVRSYHLESNNRLKEGRMLTEVSVAKSVGNPGRSSVSVSTVNSSIRVEDVEEYLDSFMKQHNLDHRPEKTSNEVFYKPYQRYWLNLGICLKYLTRETAEEHLGSFPWNFQFLVREFARVAEQTEVDFLNEFYRTEAYLLYKEHFQSRELVNLNSIRKDKSMKGFVTKAEKHW